MQRGSPVLCEAVAGLLLLGILGSRPDLEQAASTALHDLEALGYAKIDASDPVRVYPLESGSTTEPNRASVWRPGTIALRPGPTGGEPAGFYLRHELMHEASYRSCHGSLPLWAEEAAAIAFAGRAPAGEHFSGGELTRLRASARIDRPLDASSYRALGRLVGRYGWPSEPCAISPQIAALLNPSRRDSSPVDYVLISMVSARVLESVGDDSAERWPPGSLLKIPFAAALDADDPLAVGRELARSDTDALLRREETLDFERWQLLLSPAEAFRPADRTSWETERHAWLGERRRDGDYALETNLHELALIVRGSLLVRPENFSELRRNGELSGSTLTAAPQSARAGLERFDALAKTGTLSTARGEPIIGYLMVAWPAARPNYLAVFRKRGVRGFSVLAAASEVLERWQRELGRPRAEVRVKLLTLLDARDVRIEAGCPKFDASIGTTRVVATTCGEFHVFANAPGAVPERVVRGLLEQTSKGFILTTDSETYADGVLAAEASDLRGAARAALRAAIVWNGLHGQNRHPEDGALCDSTHCMVFRGAPRDPDVVGRERTDTTLLRALDQLAREAGLSWLPFSKGGRITWSRDVASGDVASAFHEPIILDLVRERTRDGSVHFHVTYPEAEETVPCESLRAALSLPSCPSHLEHRNGSWTFDGVGQGHGLGLDVERARELSREGATPLAILRSAYATAEDLH